MEAIFLTCSTPSNMPATKVTSWRIRDEKNNDYGLLCIRFDDKGVRDLSLVLNKTFHSPLLLSIDKDYEVKFV